MGACSSKAKLTVVPKTNDELAEEAPRFLSSLRDANADEGQMLEIGTPFVANPIPEIIWSKDGSKFRIQLLNDCYSICRHIIIAVEHNYITVV